jgi:hypothetical protein
MENCKEQYVVEGFASDLFFQDKLCFICTGITQVVLHPLKFPDLTTSYYFLFPKPKLVLMRKRTGNIIVIKGKTSLHLWSPKYRTSIEASNNAKIAKLAEHTYKERIHSINFLSYTTDVKEVNV